MASDFDGVRELEAEERGYQRAIDELLKVPSHETHVAVDWLEARRDGRQPTLGASAQGVGAYRDAQDEIAALRQDLDQANAELDRLGQDYVRVMAERDQAVAKLGRDHCAELRTAVRSIVDMATQGTALPAFMHAVVELRRFVEPEVTS